MTKDKERQWLLFDKRDKIYFTSPHFQFKKDAKEYAEDYNCKLITSIKRSEREVTNEANI